MGKGSCTFRQRDLAAAIKAAASAGLELARVEIDRFGKIVLVSGKAGEPASDLDRELADFEAQHESRVERHSHRQG